MTPGAKDAAAEDAAEGGTGAQRVRVEAESLVAELSGLGLQALPSLEHCSSLVELSLASNPMLSLDGLQAPRLWSLDLRNCALLSVEPLVRLGALGHLDLRGNRLCLPAVLELRRMALGRLALHANPLLPRGVPLPANHPSPGGAELLLRSLLIELLPCVVALDDSFVSVGERLFCCRYFEAEPDGMVARAHLLGEAVPPPPPSDAAIALLRRRDSRADALGALFASHASLLRSDAHARAQADARRLRWLAVDYDESEQLHAHEAARRGKRSGGGGGGGPL